MGIGRLLLIAILAGLYSGVLDEFQYHYGINAILSNVILALLLFVTAYFLTKWGRESKPN
ncbi:hypothetical protein FS935_01490 [Metabacillus litoralis]|uniref:Uncharacterized protein n=1 Tax=Metabacillus litoralis TaxID=152268 RepID=A0A5C6W6D6_9BACI|nr:MULTISPECIES: hypothetical protein [Metabacillus]MBM7602429.1 ABC-type Mn2+/Zn2+ transport system permease subunit [Metabacillus crassostreae]TXC92893.1 hypothetical protein FS935_01490 [Metabacillus litoralis]